MTTEAFYAVAYSTHHFANPISPALLDRVLEPAGLRPGGRAADLGCGGGAMAVHLAERYGLEVDAVDMSELMLAGARARLATPPAAGSVTLHRARAEDFLAEARPYDLLVVMGASELVTAAGSREAFFGGLRERLAPGGQLLYGDPFWRRAPSAALGAVMVPYGGHADYLRAGEAAGLEARCAVESPLEDWDEFAWRMARNVSDWARDNPDHPGAGALKAQARFMLESYLGETRDALGFGLYLFRAP